MTHVDGGGVPAGTQLNGIYAIEKRIAIGGMGEVYIGRVIQTGDKVAIKMILPEHASNQTIVDLFRREASTLHNLYHEAIVRYYVFSVDPVLNRPYLSMEFAAGPALGDRLQDGPLDEDELTVLRRRVAGGLHAAHRLGVIHRDISPDNIILVDGRVEKAKIIDFGIAKSRANEGTLIGSGFAGKLNYVSPEQLGLAGGEVTPKSDIYALGLVFAQAATGRPLPMGGSQVEVIDKRRVVPPLDEVPTFIRPLIEAMLQPDPADRPADMQAVADWTPPGASPAAAAGGGRHRPLHPRERRQEQAGSERRGLPWVWIGLGGGVVAAAAVAAVLFLGDEQRPSETDGEGIELAAAVEAAAPPGVVGEAYDWTLPRFDLPGNAADLVLKAHDPLPPGLSVAPTGDGTARISGTPTEAGDYEFDILASTPSGKSAWHEVRLTVREAERVAAPETPEAESGDPTPGQTPGDNPDGAAPGDAGPSIATTGPGDLTQPSAASDGAVDADPPDGRPQPARPGAPALDGQAGAGALPVIPAGEEVPFAELAQPELPADAPGDLARVDRPGDSSGVPAAMDGDAPIPHTGQPQRPSGAAPGPAASADAAIAALPAPENRPPTLDDPLGGIVEAVQGQQINVRLGAFGDEEGASALELDVQGALPRGVNLDLAQGGIAQLYGTPAEFGDYDLRIAAVDPQGLTSLPVTITLEVAPPAENRTVRDYILGYDGGDCFLSRPVELGPQLAQIEVFAAEARIQPVLDFDAAFKRDMGFEATIGMRPISEDQCELIRGLDDVGAQALDNALAISLDRDELAAGEAVSGTIRGGAGARLYLFDHTGGLTDLSEFVEAGTGGAEFSVPISASGPQILVAAKPREGADIPPTASLDALLAAARRGEAALALGFFIMKG